MRSWFATVLLAVAVVAGASLAGAPARAAKAANMMECFADLERGTAPEISCEFPLQPSPAERAEIEKQTSGYLKNATCVVSIRIARSLVADAIATPDTQFNAPPQPVSCKVTMPGKAGDQIIPIGGTFAPHVTIKDGIATYATPGLGSITGVSRILSIPVAAYINRAGFLRDGMLRVINTWMVHLRAAKGKAG